MDRSGPTSRLLEVLRAPGPSLTIVTGDAGLGKTSLLHRATTDDPATVYYACTPIPAKAQRELLDQRLSVWCSEELEPEQAGDWSTLFTRVVAEVERSRRRLILVLDDAHHLLGHRARLAEAIARSWTQVRAHSLPIHLILAGTPLEMASALGGEDSPLRVLQTDHIELMPLDYREVADRVPDYPPRDRLVAYGIFGGWPSRVQHLDPSVSLTRNVSRAILAPGAPLQSDGFDALRDRFQNITRYTSLLRSMARGGRGWREILSLTGELESGGQMAPYLARLEEHGLICAECSLDASQKSRRRRYRIRDPFIGFWYRFVLPNLSDLSLGASSSVWASRIRPRIDEHMSRWFPVIARDFLLRHARTMLPALAREVGGLWGAEYDLDIGATLTNGAIAYGRSRWSSQPLDVAFDDELAAQLRQTRYGFGREARLRLLIGDQGFTPQLRRRAARDHLLYLLGPTDLLGE